MVAVPGRIASILFGVLVFVRPGAGALALALALVWLIGFYAILMGILLLAFGLRARAWLNLTGPLGELSAAHNR